MPQFLVSPNNVDPVGGQAVVTGAEARHLALAFRARPGDRVFLFDGAGRRWCARVCEVAPEAVRLDGLEGAPSNESRLEVTLVQSVPKGDRWTWVLEKATELGVTRIVPVRSRFSVAVYAEDQGAAKVRKWQALAAAAAKQCERGHLPAVGHPTDLARFLASLEPPAPGEARVVLAERSAREGPLPSGAVERAVLAVGPEGGWAPDELDAFGRSGFVALSLGPRILRSETAAVAGVAALQLRWGDLADPRPPC